MRLRSGEPVDASSEHHEALQNIDKHANRLLEIFFGNDVPTNRIVRACAVPQVVISQRPYDWNEITRARQFEIPDQIGAHPITKSEIHLSGKARIKADCQTPFKIRIGM